MSASRKNQGSVLYISHYFPPECNAPANRVYETASAWASQGLSVQVLTGFPNHPDGIIPGPYRRKIYQRENLNRIDVHRTWVYAAASTGFIRRTINYLSFMISAIIVGLTKVERADCVIATSPQIFVAVAGWILSAAWRVPFVFEVRDLWPEEIVAVGAIKNRLIIRTLEKLEMFLYRRADKIVAVARGTVDTLVSRGIPVAKISLIPNGVACARFRPTGREKKIRESLGIGNNFLVSYIGTVGIAHHLETMLEAAEILRGDPRITFLIVGDGAQKKELEAMKARLGLVNIIFHERQTREDIVDWYHASDCCLVHLRRADLFTRNIPSKIYEIMACGKPILLGTRGESKKLVSQARCGVFFAPENARDLANGICRLANRPRWQKRLGKAGRSFVRERFDRSDLAVVYRQLIEGVITGYDHDISYPKITLIKTPGESINHRKNHPLPRPTRSERAGGAGRQKTRETVVG